jgi:hypothetical protein
MKKLIIALLLSLSLAITSSTVIAADYVAPRPIEGYTYLSEAYDKAGNVLVFIDATGNNVCDLAVVFFLMTGKDGKKLLVPSRQLSCNQGSIAVGMAREQMYQDGNQPMIWDNDLGRLVKEQNRHI